MRVTWSRWDGGGNIIDASGNVIFSARQQRKDCNRLDDRTMQCKESVLAEEQREMFLGVSTI